MATISGGRSTGVVSEIDGMCTTIHHGPRPRDLPAHFWREPGKTTVRDRQSRVSTVRQILEGGRVARGTSMHLTQFSDYSLRLASYLACHPGRVVSVDEVS